MVTLKMRGKASKQEKWLKRQKVKFERVVSPKPHRREFQREMIENSAACCKDTRSSTRAENGLLEKPL